jgi:hypothetical protein
MNLKLIVQKVVMFFKSGKAEAVLNEAADLVPKALPVVEQIAAMVPNKTDQEILAAFRKYAVPGAAAFLATPLPQRGYVLLHLATEVLAGEFPGTATNILNAAVQLAVTGFKA